MQKQKEMRRGLQNRHLQMIALGGAIGTGLFYGSASTIKLAGPSVMLAYLTGGVVIFLIMRMLGEMAVEEPVSGSFSHYAAKYWGAFPGFLSGWNYWFNYVIVSMAELSVIGIYMNYWLPDLPQWLSALVCLTVITILNLTNVRAYGEMEFWMALVKITAIVLMIGLGGWLLVTGASGAGKSTLLRALAGLWPFAHGRAAFPADEKRLFLSQRPYLPLGTLARAVAYPLTAQGPREEMERALRLVGMEDFLVRLDEVADWSHILSLGEQQRIAFARVLLVRPAWAFLDEATSALDEAREKELYEMLARELPEMGVVSVGHRSTLRGQHGRELHLSGAGGFTTHVLAAST